MAQNISSYLIVRGQKQGLVRGGNIQRYKEGWIDILAYNHEIQTDLDASSRPISGKRQHQPLTVWKEIDRSTVNLYRAFIENETLSSVELKNYSPNRLGTAGGKGAETHVYSITLTNAKIVGIKSEMLNIKTRGLIGYERTEEISFGYEKIEFRWHLENEGIEDYW